MISAIPCLIQPSWREFQKLLSVRGRTGINTSVNGSTKHDIRSVSMIKGSSETCSVSNDTTSHDEDWLVSSNSVVLEINKNLLNTSDILINFVTSVNKLDEWDVVGIEVLLESV